MADLPCRLIVVLGLPSGGTSAVTGTLSKNGYWNRGYHNENFESPDVNKLPKIDLHRVFYYFWYYKKEALDNGYDKAVVKMFWTPSFKPEFFGENRIKITVEPLLVYRDPVTNIKSLIERNLGNDEKDHHVKKGQPEILKLHKEKGWPLFEFSKNATHEQLENVVGHELKEFHFDPEKVRF